MAAPVDNAHQLQVEITNILFKVPWGFLKSLSSEENNHLKQSNRIALLTPLPISEAKLKSRALYCWIGTKRTPLSIQYTVCAVTFLILSTRNLRFRKHTGFKGKGGLSFERGSRMPLNSNFVTKMRRLEVEYITRKAKQ